MRRMRRPLVLAVIAGLAGCRSAPPTPSSLFAATPSGEAVTLDDAGTARRWAPAGPPRAAVVVLADDAEPAAPVVALCERLAAGGAIVVAPERPAPLATRYRAARALVARLRGEAPAAPLFIVGRGDAGVIALRVAQTDAAPIAGVAVVRPQLGRRDPSALAAAVSRTYVGGSLEHAVVPLWDQVAALDEPLLVVERAGDDEAIAVAGDLIERSTSRDGAVRTHPEPLGAAAADDAAAWIAARAQAPVAPSRPPRSAPGRRGWATGLASRVGALRGDGGDLDATVGIRALYAHGGVGWAGGFELDNEALTFMPVGLGARLGIAGQVAVVGGVGLRSGLGGIAPVEALLELPLGRHLRALTGARVLWELDGDRADHLAAGIDEVQVRLGLRVLGDRRLWQRASAGAGPFLGVIYRRLGADDMVGLELGWHFWGGR
jgi:alpha-beta hydrolase superfamily lysophospholipase